MRVNISHSLFNSTRLECIIKNNINATSPVDKKKKNKTKTVPPERDQLSFKHSHASENSYISLGKALTGIPVHGAKALNFQYIEKHKF